MLPKSRLTCLAALLLAGCAAPPSAGGPGGVPGEARTARTCVIAGGRLREVQVEVHAATGDTTYRGRPFRSAFPLTADYAQEAAWYVENEPMPESVWPVEDARGDYVKYGPPRTEEADSLTRISSWRGVGVYAGQWQGRLDYGVLYVPVRPGCWFHRYQFVGVGEVRGG